MKIIKDFDLLSPKWLEIAFEKKNKQYGAYELRNDSSNRHLKALLIVFVIGLLAIFLPKVVSRIEWKQQDVTQEGNIKVTEFVEPENKPEDQMQEAYVEPPPIMIKTIQLTQIQVEDDDKVDPTQQQTIQEIVESNITIGTTTHLEGEENVRPTDIAPIVNVVDENIIYEFVPTKARFPGGDNALNKWLNDNINYPIVAIENGIQGNVFVRFVVRPDGRIDGVEVLRKVHPSLDNEAIRLVKAMPRWQAGENKDGQKVSSYFSLPVKFVLK